MRKSRLIILPARCLARLGFLLLYLSCPILADMSRGTPDSGLAASFQLQVLEHCASPPEDPGDGGCSDLRNDPVKMTWPDNPDTEPTATCSNLDVFRLDNTCSSDERPRYARNKPRRLLAARYTETPQEAPKLQVMRRPIKFRSLKKNQYLGENESSERRTARTSVERRSAVNNDDTKLAERHANRRSSELPLYRRVSELDNTRRTTIGRLLSIDGRDTSRRKSTERQTFRRISSAVEYSRTSTERRSLHRMSVDRRTMDSDISRRVAIEREAFRQSFERRITDPELTGTVASTREQFRRSPNRRVYESNIEKRINDQVSRRVSERKITSSEPSRLSGERRSSRRSFERRMPETEFSRIVSSRMGVTERRNFESVAARRNLLNRQTAETRGAEFKAIRSMSNERQIYQIIPSDNSLETRFHQIGVVERRQLKGPVSETRFTDSRKNYVARMSELERRLSRKSQPIPTDARRLGINVSERQAQYEKRNSLRRTIRSVSLDRLMISQRRSSEDQRSMRMSTERLSVERRGFSEVKQRVSFDRRSPSVSEERRLSSRISNDRESARSSDVRLIRRESVERRVERSIDRRSPERRTSEERRSTRSYQEILSPSRLSSERLASEERRNFRTHRERSFSRNSIERVGTLRRSDERSASSGLVKIERRALRIPRNANSERHNPEVLISTASRNTNDVHRVSLTRSARISVERVISTRDSRSYIEPSTARLDTRKMSLTRNSNERVTSTRNLGNRMSSRKSTKRVAVIRDSIRNASARLGINREARKTLDRDTPSRESSLLNDRHAYTRTIRTNSKENLSNSKSVRSVTERAYAERTIRRLPLEDMPNRNSRRSVERSLVTRNSHRINTERVTNTRGTTRSLERSPFEKDMRRSSIERVMVNRESRRSSEHSTTIRNSRDRVANFRSEKRSTDNVNAMSSFRSMERLSDTRGDRSTDRTVATRSFRSTSVERLADTRRDRRSAERLTYFRDSRTQSAERLTSRRDNRKPSVRQADNRHIRRMSTERISGRKAERSETLQKSQSMSSERLARARRADNRLTTVRVSSRLYSDRLASSKDFEVTNERFRTAMSIRSSTADRRGSSRDSRSQLSESNRNFRRTSVDRRSLSTEREHASTSTRSNTDRNYSDVSPRRTSFPIRSSANYLSPFVRTKRESTIAAERRLARDSKSSQERMYLQRDNIQSRGNRVSERSSVRNSRSKSSDRVAYSRSIRSTERLITIRDSRQNSAERLVESRASRRSNERLALVRDSRRSTFARNVRDSRRSNEVLATLSDTGVPSSELSSMVRNNRILTQRLADTRDSRRMFREHLSNTRDSRISSQRMNDITFSSRTSTENLATLRDNRISRGRTVRDSRSRENLATYRSSRRSVDSLTDVRDSRRIFRERSIASVYSRMSSERMASLRESRRMSADREARRNKRTDERIMFNRNSRTSTERLASIRNTERVTSIVLQRRSTERLASIRDSRAIHVEQLAMSRLTMSSTERMAESRDARSVERRQLTRNTRSHDRLRVSTQGRSNEERAADYRNSRRSNERLFNVRDRRQDERLESRRLAERLSSIRTTRRERYSRETADRSLPIRNIRTMLSVRHTDLNRSSIRRNIARDFRRVLPETIQTQRNLRRSLEQITSLRDIRNIHLQTSASRHSFARIVRMTNIRISADRRNSARVVLERQSMATQLSTERNLSARRQSMARISSAGVQAVFETVPSSDQENFVEERQLNNVTLKTDSLSGIGLSVGATLSLKEKTWYSILFEHMETILASFVSTLSLICPALTIWKTSFADSLMDMDFAFMLPSKMDQINSFFTDKLSPHYALVPDNLATKSISPISREGASILTSAIGGGATAALTFLAVRSK